MAERVDCLYRVSTTKQVDHDEQNQADIPVQRKACREFAAKMGWTIVHEEQENGVSGYKVSASDRDKLQLLKERAEQGKFDILLVFMFDRLGRKSDETPFVVEWFVKHGIPPRLFVVFQHWRKVCRELWFTHRTFSLLLP